MKKSGLLFYDFETNRYDIEFSAGKFYGGLHCGECFEVAIENNSYVQVRIEYSWENREWYLIGLEDTSLNGLRVRIAV